MHSLTRGTAVIAVACCFLACGTTPHAHDGSHAIGTASSSEQRAERYFESIHEQPPLLSAFLGGMPKGGDIHSHLVGAVYAESYIAWAAKDGLCVKDKTSALLPGPCEGEGLVPAKNALEDEALYQRLMNAFSMQAFDEAHGASKDHFFDAFDKFRAVARAHTGEMIAEVARRAAAQNESYLELSLTCDHGVAAAMGQKAGWDDDFAKMQAALGQAGLADAADKAKKAVAAADAEARTALGCDKDPAARGCDVAIRYLCQVPRGLPKEQVFAHLLAAFATAKGDPRVVGINLVAPEDNHTALRDYHLQMRMLDFLHRAFPEVHITLHAGELSPGGVPREDLRFHVREAIEIGHAERIGHGVDVFHEDRAVELVHEMAKRRIPVEICLTSDDLILDVQGTEHPLPLYLQYGVPITLATDDEGVSRTDLTNEYLRAAETYGLGYGDLKAIARTSLEASFLPGPSLWADAATFRMDPACAGSTGEKAEGACAAFVAKSEKARAEWDLERRFAKFESTF